MKNAILFLITAVVSWLVGGINPAILLSNLIYHQDIRTLGSHNPGFTNFKRVFGGRWAWTVFALDLLKSILLCTVFGELFRSAMLSRQLGAAFAGLFAMLGHAYPVWYQFHGGKCFSVAAAAIWFVDWRAGAVATAILLFLLFTAKYMSLSVLCAAFSCPITLAVVGTENRYVWWICLLSVALMTFRHRKNIARLLEGTEPRFRFGEKKTLG